MSKRINKIAQNYQQVGKLPLKVARDLDIKQRNIYISDNNMLHIQKWHKKELEQLGISAKDFVNLVVHLFNQVRKGSGTSLLLVVYNVELHYVAAIDLNYSLKNDFWEIKTAQPRRTKEVEKQTLLWSCLPLQYPPQR